MNDFRVYRRDLPHWRQTGRTYFVTWRVRAGVRELDSNERDLVARTLQFFHAEKYWLHAFVVMNDHVHALVTPIESHSIESIVGGWKSYTTQQSWKLGGRKGDIWQVEYFDRIVRNQEEFIEKARHILNNPYKRWPTLQGYLWVGTESEIVPGAGTESRPHQD